MNIVISTSYRLLTCANRTTARRFWFRQSATKWVETLRPKWTFWRFPDFKRGKDSVSSPIPSMQCCATVRATFRKQETSQLWMEGTGEGCGFLCFRSYPIWVQCLNTDFVADCCFSQHSILKDLKQNFVSISSIIIVFWSLNMAVFHLANYSKPIEP